MNKLISKSLIVGYIIGTVFFIIAPLGLGIYSIEILKPVLTPGISFIQLLGQTTFNPAYIIFSLFLNGLFYSILVLIFLLAQAKFKNAQ